MNTTKKTASVPRAGGMDRIRTPHKAYMKLSSLELEKARLLQEHVTLLKRIRVLEERVLAIETEQRTLHGMVPAPGPASPESSAMESHPGLRPEPQGLQSSSARATGMSNEAADKDRFRFRY